MPTRLADYRLIQREFRIFSEGRHVMSNHHLALLRERMSGLLKIRAPGRIDGWIPTAIEREEYSNRLRSILELDARIHEQEQEHLHEGHVQTSTNAELLKFYRTDFEPARSQLQIAARKLGLVDFGRGVAIPTDQLRPVKLTFEEGLGHVINEAHPEIRVAYVIEGKPGAIAYQDIDQAIRVTDSSLISFDPDAWLQRADEISIIRTENGIQNEAINSRLRELFRAYVFGNFMSVLAMARALLEASIIDNADRLGVDMTEPDPKRPGQMKRKDLKLLIEDTAKAILTFGGSAVDRDRLAEEMHNVRERGNDLLHWLSNRSGRVINIESQRDLQKQASKVLRQISHAIEVLYRVGT